MAELRAWQPGYIDRMRYGIASLLGDDRQAMRDAEKLTGLLEYTPVLGDAMTGAEAVDEYNAGNYGTAGLLAAATAVGAVPVVGDAASKGIKKGIRAYHGSPHDFDRFDISKIGTGEGAQAYGHGLYFAESEGVAKSYRDQLARPYYATPDGESVAQKFGDDVLEAFQNVNGDPQEIKDTIFRLREAVKRNLADYGVSDVSKLKPEYEGDLASSTIQMARRADGLEALLGSGDVELVNKGRMYEVNINANPEDFLDWDKPLSEQPEGIRNALNNFPITTQIRDGMPLGPNAKLRIEVDPDLPEYPRYFMSMDTGTEFRLSEKDLKNFAASSIDEASGKTALTTIASEMGISEREASQKLKEAGIPGIKYLDAGSRGAGDGSRNYVVFDDALIEILRKYGIAGLGLLGAGGAAYNSEQDGPAPLL
jgi:hypothetical protein